MKKPIALVLGIGKPKPSRGAAPPFPFSKKADSGADPSADPSDPASDPAPDDDQAEDDDQQAKISHAYDLIEQACAVLKELMGSGPDDAPSSAMGNPAKDDQLAA